jgi:hypothetical protein
VGKAFWLIVFTAFAAGTSAGQAGLPVWEYPSAVLDAYDADGSCWTGMDAAGAFPRRVVPEDWLVGPPPSEESALTLPADHWIDLAFSGWLADGDGNDIVLTETGKAGEQALLFVTDGADQEYLLNRVTVENSSQQDLSRLGFDLAGVSLPFVPRAVRLVALDLGGQSPGFDLSSARARVSHECGPRASCPNPVSGAVGISPYSELTWTPACASARPVLYWGEAAAEVAAGAAAVRHPLGPEDANTFAPPALGLGRTYYWRVDEIRDDGSGAADPGSETPAPDPWPPACGDLWSFTVADRLVLDDFEAYDPQTHFLYDAWQPRGWAGVSIEQGIVRSCRQSMSFHYHYDATWFSEVVRTFATPQDWARPQAEVLQMLVRGTGGNTAQGGLMYVTLGDGRVAQSVPYMGDLSVLADPRWTAWRLALADFDQIDLAHVTSMAIGLRPATTSPQDRGVGTIYIDDITLHPALCLQDRDAAGAEGGPAADLTGDCTVDFRDLQRLGQDWLYDPGRLVAVTAPNEPILRYDFEGDARDLAGTADGLIQGRCNFVPGVYGWAIDFASQGDAVTVPEAANVFAHARTAITIMFWQRGADSGHRNDTICCSNYVYGQLNPTIAIHLGCWRGPGQYRWDCGVPWSFANRVAGRHQDASEWSGRWNHWAFTKRTGQPSSAGESTASPSQAGASQGRMEIYLNGRLYDCREGTDTPIVGITSFEIGTGWYGRYDGAIDDFRIYDYALSPAEIAHAATRGTGVFPQAANSPADLDADGTVNLHDLALLATEWLQTNLWP